MNKNNPVLIRNEHDEVKQVKKDLIKVISLNLIFFAVLIGLFFYNRSTGSVDAFFANLLKF